MEWHRNERIASRDWAYVGGDPTLWRAKIALAEGRRQQALLLLRQALSEGLNHWSRAWGSRFHVDVDLEPLFDDPAYQELMALRS